MSDQRVTSRLALAFALLALAASLRFHKLAHWPFAETDRHH